jgi:hypothetical protein
VEKAKGSAGRVGRGGVGNGDGQVSSKKQPEYYDRDTWAGIDNEDLDQLLGKMEKVVISESKSHLVRGSPEVGQRIEIEINNFSTQEGTFWLEFSVTKGLKGKDFGSGHHEGYLDGVQSHQMGALMDNIQGGVFTTYIAEIERYDYGSCAPNG